MTFPNQCGKKGEDDDDGDVMTDDECRCDQWYST